MFVLSFGLWIKEGLCIYTLECEGRKINRCLLQSDSPESPNLLSLPDSHDEICLGEWTE